MGLASCIMLGIIIWATFQVNDVHNRSELRLSGLRLGIIGPAITAYFLFSLGYVIYMTFQVSWLRVNGADAILASVVWSLMGVAVVAYPFMWRQVLSQPSAGRAIALTTLTVGLAALIPLFGCKISVFISSFMFGCAMFVVPKSATNFAKTSLAQPVMGAVAALFTLFFSLGQILEPISAGYVLDKNADADWLLFLSGSIFSLGTLSALWQSAIKSPKNTFDSLPKL